MVRNLMIGAVALCAIGVGTAPAHAQAGRNQAELQRLHALCDQNYKPACIRFGYILGANQVRRNDWQRAHPNWWWWDRY
jgi:hypothetical protein